jgi:hypothetical protein
LGKEIDDDGLTEKIPKRGYGSSSVRGERKLGKEIDGGSTEKSPKSGPKRGYGSSSVRGERKLGKEIDGGSTEKSPKSRGYGSSSLRGERKLGKEIDGGSTEKSPKSGPKRGYGSSSVRGERKLGTASSKESKSEKSEGKKKVRSRRAERTIDEEDEKRQKERRRSFAGIKDALEGLATSISDLRSIEFSTDGDTLGTTSLDDATSTAAVTLDTPTLNDDGQSSTTQQSALVGDVPIAAENDGLTSGSKQIKASSLHFAKEEFTKRPLLRRSSSLGAMDVTRPEMMITPVRRNNSFGDEGKGKKQNLDLHRVETHKLQQQLSEALEKIVKVSEEHGRVKDSLWVASTKLTETAAALANSTAEVSDLKAKLAERNSEVEENKQRIASLEKAVEMQLDNQDALEVKLEAADEEINKMETEIKLMDGEIAVLKTKNGKLMDLCEELDEARRLQQDLQRTVDEQVLLLDERESKIKTLEQEMCEHSDFLQKIETLTQENVRLQGKLKSEQLEIGVRLSKKSDAIDSLQKEMALMKKDSNSHESGEFAALSKELKECQKHISLAIADLEHAQRRIGRLEEENEDLQGANGKLKGELKTLEKSATESATESATKAEEMQELISHWTEKTFEWKLRAEAAEKKLDTTQAGPGSDSEKEEGAQALFLQAAMERKRAGDSTSHTNTLGKKWAMFMGSRPSLDDTLSESNPEDPVTKIDHGHNEFLEEQIAKLQSDMVKLQTVYKEESYTNTKKLEQLQVENSAYSEHNAILAKLVGEVHFADAIC